MRKKIMEAILACACEENKDNNARVAQLREVYPYLEGMLDREVGLSEAKLQEAMTVGDFPLYFGRTLQAKLMERYNYRMGNWKQYTLADQVPDFRAADRLTFDEFGSLLAVRREKEEAYSDFTREHRHQLAVTDFALQVDFSRQILVNDDLGAFLRVPSMLGDAARRFEDWFVSALYDNALSQASLIGLGAAYAGTGRLTTANLAIGYNAFVQRVDIRGNPIAIAPRYLVIPPILRLQADTILSSERIAELATNANNAFGPKGSVNLTVVEDPNIAFAGINIPWYLFADPNDIPAVTVPRLTGVAGPELYAKAPDKLPFSTSGALGSADWRRGSFISGDIEIEVETCIGARSDSLGAWVGITDPNGIYYSSGTTP